MSVGMLIQEIRNHGLEIDAIDGDLHVRPRERITDALRQIIRMQKTTLVDFLEAHEERAAIMEFDGGMSRQEAEVAAHQDCAAPEGQANNDA